MMKQEVIEAINELKEFYGDENVDVSPDNNGGAYIIVNNIELNESFSPKIIWCGFHINHMYSMSDVYPHFINPELKLNGEVLKGPFQYNKKWNNRLSIQVSRRSKRWNPAYDTALVKLQKVLEFIKSR